VANAWITAESFCLLSLSAIKLFFQWEDKVYWILSAAAEYLEAVL